MRPDTPKPEAILLVLDSTNLGRHLMLAAPILALGLPTLIILNMADDLRNRGGKLDLDALAAQLGAPVALISARQGEGIDQVFDFLAGAMPKPAPKELPVLQDVPKCREWAGRVGSQAATVAPDPAQVDAPPGSRFSASGGRAAGLCGGGGGRVSDHLHGGRSAHRLACSGSFDISGNWIAATLPPSLLRSLLVEGVWKGVGSVVGLPAAGAAAVPVHRHSGGFRLPGARGADRRPHHGARSGCRESRSSRCFRRTPARCRPSWPRAPSRTSATASPPF